MFIQTIYRIELLSKVIQAGTVTPELLLSKRIVKDYHRKKMISGHDLKFFEPQFC